MPIKKTKKIKKTHKTSALMTRYITVNPTTGEKLQEYFLDPWSTVQKARVVSSQAQADWKQSSFEVRSGLLLKLAQELRRTSAAAAKMMAIEMGKPIPQGLLEIEKCAVTCEYFANDMERLLRASIHLGKNEKTLVVFRPLGVILGVMPWNFPFWQVIRFAVPTLAIGNSIIVKHALNTSGCAFMLQSIFNSAGFPPGLFQILLMDHPTASKLLSDPRVAGVSLTGSTRAGIEIAQTAALTLKKCVFELGGSDPYIILEDAPLEKAVEICGRARLLNSGQSCVAAKRFIVHQKLIKPFTEGLVEFFKKQKIGDPLMAGTTVGPLARHDLRDNLSKQVAKSIRQGARLVYQTALPKNKGAFSPCTILDKVEPGQVAFDEELFGPAAAIISVKTEKDAIELANQSSYGLGASLISSDIEKAERLAIRDVEAGNVFVNDNVKSMPAFPFGGIKMSGYGRELGEFGIHEFANIKTVHIASS